MGTPKWKRMKYKVVKFDMAIFRHINKNKDPLVHLNAVVKNTFSISRVTHIKKDGTVNVIYCIFYIILESR